MDYNGGMFDANSMQIFVPANKPGAFYPTFAARVDGNAEDFLAKMRDAVQSVDDQAPVFGAKTMEERLARALLRPRFYTTIAVCFAAFALILAVIGVYGVVSYAVSQRTQEMGIRMALGTSSFTLRRTVLSQGLLPVVLGSLPGIVCAQLAGRFLGSLVAGAKPPDLELSILSVGFVLMVATTSIWAATRRISALDIMDILRSQ
jgi:ABC-type lipoprotein release transport system permease subunit